MNQLRTRSGKEPVAFAAKRGTRKYHWIDEDGLSLCGIVFSRTNDETSKEERGTFSASENQRRRRRPWRKWGSDEDISDRYEPCGSCKRTIDALERETRQNILSDIRDLIGIGSDSDTITKEELRQMRQELRND